MSNKRSHAQAEQAVGPAREGGAPMERIAEVLGKRCVRLESDGCVHMNRAEFVFNVSAIVAKVIRLNDLSGENMDRTQEIIAVSLMQMFTQKAFRVDKMLMQL